MAGRYDTLVVVSTWNLTTMNLSDHLVAYVDTGPQQGGATPLVLLHGGAADHRMWWPQLSAFDDRRVVAPDARGHGGTSDAERAYRLCDDVIALLDALEIEQAVLAGISMGGGTAVDVALEHPGRITGLVVGGTGTSEPEFSEPWALEAFAARARAEAEADAEAWIEAALRFVPGPDRTRDDVETSVLELIETMTRDTLAAHVTIGPDGAPVPPVLPTPVLHTWSRLPRIEVPVLAVNGSHDGRDNREMGRRLAGAVPRGTYREIEGAAHYPNLERPEVFNSELERFLSRHAL